MPPKKVSEAQAKKEIAKIEKEVTKVEKKVKSGSEAKQLEKIKKRYEKLADKHYKLADKAEERAKKFHETADRMQKKKMEKYYLMLDHVKHLRMLGDSFKRASKAKPEEIEDVGKEIEEHAKKVVEVKQAMRPKKAEKKVEEVVIEETPKSKEKIVEKKVEEKPKVKDVEVEKPIKQGLIIEEKPKEKKTVKIEPPKPVIDEEEKAAARLRNIMKREDEYKKSFQELIKNSSEMFESDEKLSKKEKQKAKQSMARFINTLGKKLSPIEKEVISSLPNEEKEKFIKYIEKNVKKKEDREFAIDAIESSGVTEEAEFKHAAMMKKLIAERKAKGTEKKSDETSSPKDDVKPHLVKGSKEAKEHMAKIRAKKGSEEKPAGGAGEEPKEEIKPVAKMSNLEKRAMSIAKKNE